MKQGAMKSSKMFQTDLDEIGVLPFRDPIMIIFSLQCKG